GFCISVLKPISDLRLSISGLCALLLAVTVPAEAQQPKKIPRIGYLSGTGDLRTPGLQVEAFQQGLREFGYIEGKNILIDYLYVEGKVDSIPSLVVELLHLKPDVFISGNL